MCKFPEAARWFHQVQIVHPEESNGAELHFPQALNVVEHHSKQEYLSKDPELLHRKFEKNAAKMEANNRLWKQTFEFEQANEKLNHLDEIAVGRQLSIAVGKEGPT